MSRFGGIMLVTFLLLARGAVACGTCFGAADAPQTAALNMAIFVLLGFIGTVGLGVASFMVFLWKRGRLVAMGQLEADIPVTLVEAGAHE
jgi:hypothetical protein